MDLRGLRVTKLGAFKWGTIYNVHALVEIPRSLPVNTSREYLSFKMTNSENPQDNDQVFALETEEENVSLMFLKGALWYFTPFRIRNSSRNFEFSETIPSHLCRQMDKYLSLLKIQNDWLREWLRESSRRCSRLWNYVSLWFYYDNSLCFMYSGNFFPTSSWISQVT